MFPQIIFFVVHNKWSN